MAHQWTADDFCNELVHVGNLLTKRPNSQVGHAALETLKQRLTSVSDLSASTLSMLYDKVEAAELPVNLKENVMQAMDNLTVKQETALEVTAKPSSLHNLPPYLTTGDWKKMEESHMLDNMRIISERLKKLGIKKLKEDTKKTAIAVLLHVHVTVHKHPLPCPWSIYGLADDFAQCFAHTDVGTTVAPLRMYPTSPNGLQKEWIKLSYGEEEPSMSSLSLAPFYPKIPLRSTSTLLQCEPPTGLKHLAKSESSSTVGRGDRLVEQLENFMDRYTPLTDSQHLHSGRRSLHQPASSSPALPLQNTAGPTTAVPLTTAPATALALPGPPPVAPSTTVVAAMPSAVATEPASTVSNSETAGKSNDKTTVEQFEEKAFQVLTGKKAAAKAKAKAKSNAKTVKKEAVLKRPAASGSTTTVKAKGPKENKIYGCPRCRGNVKGCSTCWNPNYTGIRFSSRAEWSEYHRSKKTAK